MKIDLLYCLCERDVEIFNYSFYSLEKNSGLAFDKCSVYIDSYAPVEWIKNIDSSIRRKITLLHGCDFFSDIEYHNIEGWYRQQYVKLFYCNKSSADRYLTWDADMIMLKHLPFIDDEKIIIYINPKIYLGQPIEYKLAIQKIFGSKFNHLWLSPFITASFINSFGMFSVAHAAELNTYKSLIKDIITGKSWMDKALSEYELYGYHAFNNHPSEYLIRTFNYCDSPTVLPTAMDNAHAEIIGHHAWLFKNENT